MTSKSEEREREIKDIDPIFRAVPIAWQEPVSITTFRNYLEACSHRGDSSYRVSQVWPPAPRPAVDQVDTCAADMLVRTRRCRRPSGRYPQDTSPSGDNLQNRCNCRPWICAMDMRICTCVCLCVFACCSSIAMTIKVVFLFLNLIWNPDERRGIFPIQ